MKKCALVLLSVLLLTACNLPAPALQPVSSPTAGEAEPGSTRTSLPEEENLPPVEESTASATPARRQATAGSALSPVSIPRPAELFHAQPATAWEPGKYASVDFALPIDPGQTANPAVLAGLTEEQVDLLKKNGFVVIYSQEAQFHEIRKEGRLYGQPYYLTTDAAFHAMHLTFAELLKAIEKQSLRPRMIVLLRSVLKESLAFLDQSQGAPLEEDARLAAAYLAVALRLFDSGAETDPRLVNLVEKQLAQIEAGAGLEWSTLVPGFQDDYSAYKPVGHYAGDPALEAYFRGMTWLGRVHFRLQDPQNPAFQPSRAPLILTLALRRAQIETGFAAGPAIDEWTEIHALLTFLVGPSDDAGPAEYSALMDQIYGNTATVETLMDEANWQAFLARSGEIPAPQINSTFAASAQGMEQERGWRFLGQRFTLDSYILQNLVFDLVGDQANPRWLPSGLDVMAAFGSQPAWQALEQAGETAYANYPAQMEKLQSLVKAQSVDQWLDTVFGSWPYAFLPQAAAKDLAYPTYMRTPAWGYKELNSALGSWAELKHDATLYSKMPESYGGGGPPSSGPAPGYVEPNPQVFYRLAALARTLSEGLQPFISLEELDPPSPEDFTYAIDGLAGYFRWLDEFSAKLQALGDIAAKELSGEPLTQDDYALIQGCLGPVECRVDYMERMHILSGGEGPLMEMPPVPVVAAVAGAPEKILQVAVGSIDRLYVIVPLEGRLEIAQGGVFSYFEFQQPRENRLTDQEWRARLAAEPPPRPAWTSFYSLPGGNPTQVTFFRIGDVYIVTQEGDRLNLRRLPNTGAAVLRQLAAGDYITILDGPVQASGYTWWKIRLETYTDTPPEGWVVENQAWYERAWGQ